MYNSVVELHIGVDLALQQLNTNRKQVVKPEEKDWFLNTTLLQVINNHIDPNASLPNRGSDSGQRVVDYLNVLKVHYKSPTVVFNDDDRRTASAPLPSDYYRKSRIDATALLTIKETDTNPVIADNEADPMRLFKGIISFDDIKAAVLTDYITASVITIGDQTIFDGTATSPNDDTKPLYDFSNVASIGAKFMMIATILEVCNSHKWVSVYWERYRGDFHSNSFIFVVDNKVAPISITDVTSLAYSVNSNNASTTLSPIGGSIITGSGGKRIPCRIVESEEFNDINGNAFFGSSYLSLNTVIENGDIVISNSNDFRVIDVDMVYYRRPKLINYKTGQNCEITADDFKVQLVNLTAQKINAFIDEGNYQKMLSENMMLL